MLKLVLLNSDQQKNIEIPVKDGISLGSTNTADFVLEAPDTSNFECQVVAEQDGGFYLESLNQEALFELGEDRESKVRLLPGLFVSFKGFLFAVQTGEVEESMQSDQNRISVEDFLNRLDKSKRETPKQVELLKKPLVLHFTQGPLLNLKWRFHFLPLSLGLHSPLYFFIDSSLKIKEDFIKFSHSKEGFFISSPYDDLIRINGKKLQYKEKLNKEDYVEFGETAFYIKSK